MVHPQRGIFRRRGRACRRQTGISGRTGVAINRDFISLGEVKQTGGKIVKAWAVKHDLDPATLKSNTFRLESAPRSGKIQEFGGGGWGAWFSLAVARGKIMRHKENFLNAWPIIGNRRL